MMVFPVFFQFFSAPFLWAARVLSLAFITITPLSVGPNYIRIISNFNSILKINIYLKNNFNPKHQIKKEPEPEPKKIQEHYLQKVPESEPI